MKHLIIIMSFIVLTSYGYEKAGAWQSQASDVEAFYERIEAEATQHAEHMQQVALMQPTKAQTIVCLWGTDEEREKCK